MAGTITYSDLRRGTIIELEGDAFAVIEYKHVAMQQRTPALTLKLRQLRSGKTFERNLPGNQRLTLADIENRQAQYLYNDGQSFYFMDTENYDQFPLAADELAEQSKFLTEGDTISLVYYQGQAVSVELAMTVDLEVVDTPPAFKGDTASSGRKPATLSTGAQVKVPMHITIGQTVRVDTRTGDYVSTVS